MRKIGWLMILAGLVAPNQADAMKRLCLPLTRNYAHLAELPQGAAAALGFPMAERGGAWNASDAVRAGPRLPFARFISAQGGGCTLSIRYEFGGRRQGVATAVLGRTDNGWMLRSRG